MGYVLLFLRHQFVAIVAGPSGYEKTQFVLTFLKNIDRIINVKFKEVIWYYTEWQKWYEKYPWI